MEARWKREPEASGTPLLGGAITRKEWEACLDSEGLPVCATGKSLSVFFPPADKEIGRKLAARWSGNEYPAPASAAVVSWYSKEDPSLLSEDELLGLAAATSLILGIPQYGTGVPVNRIAGLEVLRKALETQCGRCAPKPETLPVYQDKLIPASSVLSGEIMARGEGERLDPVPPLGTLVALVRKGKEPLENATITVGQAGLVALEWGRAGNPDKIEALLKIASEGPSSSDRLAALYAVIRLSNGQLATWRGLPGYEEIVATAEQLAPAVLKADP
jgi:hypothetical protein